MGYDTKTADETIDHEFNIMIGLAVSSEERFVGIEEQRYEIVEDILHEGEDDIVGVGIAHVRGSFAQLDASERRSLVELSIAATLHAKSLDQIVDEEPFPSVLGQLKRDGVSVDDLFEDLRRQDEQHHLKGPDRGKTTLLVLGESVERVEELAADARQLSVGRARALNVNEFLRISVHPIPHGFFQRAHQHEERRLLEQSALLVGLCGKKRL